MQCCAERVALTGYPLLYHAVGALLEHITKKTAVKFITAALKKLAITYSPTLHRSTIGANGLNFSVRDGKRWNPAAIVA